jgi:sec-independent protein translocase protein TatC
MAIRIRRKAASNGSTSNGSASSVIASDEDLARMTLLEHLAELRKRLIISILAVTIGTLVAFFLYTFVLDFITHPYHSFLNHHPNQNISKGNLITTGPLEGFTTRLKVSGYLGLFFASPIVLWEIWRFITPGLHKNEKRYAIPFILGTILLFTAGVTVSVLVFPKALDFLISISGKNVTPLFSPQRYVSLYVAMAGIFGLVFCFPMVQIMLEISGAVPTKKWRKWRRPAIVILFLVAAVATPSNDPYSFFAMAIPLVVFYELSIIVGRIMKK